MNTYIAPSMLSADFNILGQQLRTIEDTGTKYLHIDVMDGSFVPSISFGMPVIKSIRKESKLFFDVHLMIDEPIRYIEEFKNCGADSITFHLEAAGQSTGTVIEKIKSLGVETGLSIKPKTPVEELIPYLGMVDMFLLMTVEPGFGGQAYIPECTDKIKALRKLLDEGGHKAHIQVDGGIKTNNIHIPLEAGANIFVAGSAIFAGDIAANIREMAEKI